MREESSKGKKSERWERHLWERKEGKVKWKNEETRVLKWMLEIPVSSITSDVRWILWQLLRHHTLSPMLAVLPGTFHPISILFLNACVCMCVYISNTVKKHCEKKGCERTVTCDVPVIAEMKSYAWVHMLPVHCRCSPTNGRLSHCDNNRPAESSTSV